MPRDGFLPTFAVRRRTSLRLEAILNEAGATLDDVASLSSYHVGDLHSQLRELVDIKATRIRPPHASWTGVGVTQLGVPGALLEISAVVMAPDY